jgi:nucleoside 2-deoxyribosyltransferase
MTFTVFVSHSSADREVLEAIKGQCGPGVELWLAEHDPKPGVRVSEKVHAAIDRSDAVIAFITPAGHSSSYVHQEIGYAIAAKKLVIPVVGTDIRRDQLAMLQGVEFIPFDFNAPSEGKDALLSRLRTLSTTAASAREETVTALLLLGALLILALLASRASKI